jgi:Flp pilus assembly pilin Flp
MQTGVWDIRGVLVRLRSEDRGQDLVEYALLAAIIAIAGVTVLPNIATRMGQLFSQWGLSIYNDAEPKPPL